MDTKNTTATIITIIAIITASTLLLEQTSKIIKNTIITIIKISKWENRMKLW